MTLSSLRFVTLGAFLALALAQTAFAGERGCSAAVSPETVVDLSSQEYIVDVAIDAGSLQTLVAAVQGAGLADALEGEGPYTVRAPTDEFFAEISEDQLDALLSDSERFIAVLTYEVVPADFEADEVVGLGPAKTVQGQPITIEIEDCLTFYGESVIQTDVETSAGVIHLIDIVILPDI